MTELYMTTDECEDILSSLKLFNDALSKTDIEISYWKWSVISLHSAIQGMMAFHLSFGDNLLVISKESGRAWLNHHRNNGDYPEMLRMDDFLNLYEKIKQHKILNFKFSPDGQEGSSIKKLNSLRNDFIHFLPTSWSIELDLMIDIFFDCINILNKLAAGPVKIRWEDDNQSNLFKSLIEESKSKLKQKKLTVNQ